MLRVLRVGVVWVELREQSSWVRIRMVSMVMVGWGVVRAEQSETWSDSRTAVFSSELQHREMSACINVCSLPVTS